MLRIPARLTMGLASKTGGAPGSMPRTASAARMIQSAVLMGGEESHPLEGEWVWAGGEWTRSACW